MHKPDFHPLSFIANRFTENVDSYKESTTSVKTEK